MGHTAQPRRSNRSASITVLLVLSFVLGVVAWQSSVRPISAQVDAWSCDGSVTASPAASPEAVSTPAPVPFPADGGTLMVYAASSLTDAFTKIGHDIQAAHPEIEVTFNFAGSQALVTQIAEGGAEADVLALASPSQMTNASKSGIPVDGVATFATNRLTVVVPDDNPAGITKVEELANDGVRLVLAGPDVPAGIYARQSLCRITATDGAPHVDEFAANVVSEEDNVRSVLTKVQLGEADAGIVYVTDALTAGEAVRMIEISPDHNVVASYPIAAISDNPLAAPFVGYVFSPEGQATLASFGFDPVE